VTSANDHDKSATILKSIVSRYLRDTDSANRDGLVVVVVVVVLVLVLVLVVVVVVFVVVVVVVVVVLIFALHETYRSVYPTLREL